MIIQQHLCRLLYGILKGSLCKTNMVLPLILYQFLNLIQTILNYFARKAFGYIFLRLANMLAEKTQRFILNQTL